MGSLVQKPIKRTIHINQLSPFHRPIRSLDTSPSCRPRPRPKMQRGGSGQPLEGGHAIRKSKWATTDPKNRRQKRATDLLPSNNQIAKWPFCRPFLSTVVRFCRPPLISLSHDPPPRVFQSEQARAPDRWEPVRWESRRRRFEGRFPIGREGLF